MASSKINIAPDEWISVQYDAHTGKVYIKRGTPKQPEVETMSNGIKRVRLVLGLPVKEGFILCSSCGGWAYEKKFMHEFKTPQTRDETYGICYGCWAKVATCRVCNEAVSPEVFIPGRPVHSYCPGCAPSAGPLSLKQEKNLNATVNILELRRNKRWESSSSEQTQRQ